MPAAPRTERSAPWARVLWWAAGILAVLAIVLGTAGFAARDDGGGFLEHFYRALQLFVLESGSVSPPIPATLQIARFLAPLVAAYAAVRGFAVLFRDRLLSAKIGRRHGHAIVCGLGDRGLAFVRSLRDDERDVTVVDPDAENDLIPAAEAEGALVLIGDARDPAVLRRARADRATDLVAVSGDDGVNAEIAAAVQSLPRSGHLHALVHVTDPVLCSLLQTEELAAGRSAVVGLDFFNVPERGARRIADVLDPALAAQPGSRVIVVGLGALGRSTLLEIGRRGMRRVAAGGSPHEAVVIGPGASDVVADLQRHYQRLDASVRIAATYNTEAEAAASGLWEDPASIHAVAVCVDGDADGLRAALTVQERLRSSPVPIVVGLEHGGGLAGAVAADSPVVPLGLLDEVCTAAALRQGTLEEVARSLHRIYNETIGGGVPWPELSDEDRASALEQAAAVAPKLAAIDCHLAPLSDWDAGGFRFTPAEVDLLAIMEHDRWRAWKEAQGWGYGDPTDRKRKRNRNLREWEELDEDVRDANRELIRVLPVALADAGQQIVRDDGPLVRAIHDIYLSERAPDRTDDPALVPWEDLSESLRDSCRDQAAHIPLKLRTLGLSVGKASEAAPFAPDEEQVEVLARMEHDRWVTHRRHDGWTAGPRDVAARTTPYLVPWEELSNEMREWDRIFVRRIPDILAAAGRGVVPVGILEPEQ